MEWLLEIVLIGLLVVTLFHALRLERALGVLKRDRAALENLVTGFNASTHAAEQGIAHLKSAADGAGRQIARHVETAVRLKDDLQFLTERGDRTADRLERAVREARAPDRAPGPPEPAPELDRYDRPFAAPAMTAGEDAEPQPKVRSRAEQDLMRALRLAR